MKQKLDGFYCACLSNWDLIIISLCSITLTIGKRLTVFLILQPIICSEHLFMQFLTRVVANILRAKL